MSTAVGASFTSPIAGKYSSLGTHRIRRADKMRKYVPGVLLWLFVINLGIAFGAGIYESRVVVHQWQTTPPQTWPNTGLQF